MSCCLELTSYTTKEVAVRRAQPNGSRLSCGALKKIHSLIYARRQLQAHVRQTLIELIVFVFWNRANGVVRMFVKPLDGD